MSLTLFPQASIPLLIPSSLMVLPSLRCVVFLACAFICFQNQSSSVLCVLRVFLQVVGSWAVAISGACVFWEEDRGVGCATRQAPQQLISWSCEVWGTPRPPRVPWPLGLCPILLLQERTTTVRVLAVGVGGRGDGQGSMAVPCSRVSSHLLSEPQSLPGSGFHHRFA